MGCLKLAYYENESPLKVVHRTFEVKEKSGAGGYGINGKESDNEVSGTGNQYDYGFRIYNPRLGKFLSVDPMSRSFPKLTPYQFASNSPLKFIDLDGLEIFVVGTVANDFVNLLAQRTGLVFTQDAQGMLSLVTTQVPVEVGNATIMTQVPLIQVQQGQTISVELRNEVIRVIQGGQNIDPVTIIAKTSVEIGRDNPVKGPNGMNLDNVAFDLYPFDIPDAQRKQSILGNLANDNAVDMTDFKNISNEQELQAALLAHIFSERAEPKKGQTGDLTFKNAHNVGLASEDRVMKEFDPKATNRIEKFNLKNTEVPNSVSEIFQITFDYGNTKYTTKSKTFWSNGQLVSNPNSVSGVEKSK